MILIKRLQQKWSKVVFKTRFHNNVSLLWLFFSPSFSLPLPSVWKKLAAMLQVILWRLPYGKKLMSLASSKWRPKPCQQLCECAQKRILPTEPGDDSSVLTAALWDLEQQPNSVKPRFKKTVLYLGVLLNKVCGYLLGNQYKVNIPYCGSKISCVQGEVMGFFKDERVRIRSIYTYIYIYIFFKFTLL